MREVLIHNLSHPLGLPLRAGYCESFLCRLGGLMLRPTLPPNWGLLLVQPAESRLEAAIHMLFMRLDLAVVWANRALQVVDVRPAYRWRSILVPRAPARYILELPLERLPDFQPGDQIALETAPAAVGGPARPAP